MKVLVELDDPIPQPWIELDSRDWGTLPNNPIQALNVQGLHFTGYDHIHVASLSDGVCRITTWKDSVPPTERIALEWTLRPLIRDERFGGAWNARSTQVVYGGASILATYQAIGPMEATEVRPWADFNEPTANVHKLAAYRDGAHEAVRALHGWREWTDGVPAEDLDERGHVADQRSRGRYRIPDGTITYFQSNTALANGIHVCNNEMALLSTTGVSATLGSGNFAGGASRTTHVWVSPSGSPNSAAWPTGNYRCQLDCTAAGAGMSYGLRTAGAVSGHFARVNSGITSDLETKTQTEALFTSTGLKLATTGSVSWTGGSATDLYEVMVAGVRAASGGNQTYTLRVNLSDDFADGPWSTATDQSMSATSVSVVTVTKETAKTLSSTAVSIAALLKETAKTLAAVTISVATLITTRVSNLAMSAISATVATLTRVMTYGRELSTASTTSATLTFATTFLRTLSATAGNVATLAKQTTKALTAAAISLVTLATQIVFTRAMSAVSVSIATMTRVTTFARDLSASIASMATLAKTAVFQRTLSAVSVVVATLAAIKAGASAVVMSATAVTVASLGRALSLTRSLSVTAISVASMAKGMARTLSATATSLASLVQQIAALVVPPPLARFASKLRVNRGTIATRSVRGVAVSGVDRGPISSGLGASLNAKVTCYWRMDETGGARADAKSGMTLTDVNTVTSNPGKVGLAGQFTRANQEYLTRASESTLQTGDIDFTIAAWVYLDSKPGTIHIMAKSGPSAALTEYLLRYEGSDVMRFYVSTGSGFSNVSAANFGSPPLATWFFVVAWHNATAETLNIQVNNGSVDSSGAIGVVIPTTTSEFTIGFSTVDSAPQECWDGRIDEVLFAKAVLTADERTFLYNSGAGRTYPF